VPKHLKTALLLHLLQEPQMNMVLVFSRMKHAADRLARQLEQKGVRCATLHSNRSQNQRLRALKDFKDGAVRVLVATDIAARGIDVDGISHVVNYDFPMHVEDYIHRIGRTGRANQIGDAISFVTNEDHAELRALERFIGRGIVRKKAEGFNYSQPAPQFNPAEEPRRHVQRGSHPQRPQGDHRRPSQRPGQTQRPQGYGGQSRGTQSSRPASGNRPPRSENARPQSRPVSGNREGGNERYFPSTAPRSGGFRRRFGGFR
jgi:ATP-dependent RNA helicase RhlE